MKAAGLALLLSWGFCIGSSVNCKLIEATILQLSRRLPHSIFLSLFIASSDILPDRGQSSDLPEKSSTILLEAVERDRRRLLDRDLPADLDHLIAGQAEEIADMLRIALHQ